MFEKYQFQSHCIYIRKYLLMGQGDLMEYLMDLLAEELEKPAVCARCARLLRASIAEVGSGE